MGNFVKIRVFKDKAGVYENGIPRIVSKDSRTGTSGYINLKDQFDVDIKTHYPPMFLMELILPDGERVWTNETVDSWAALLPGTGGGGGGVGSGTQTITEEYTVGNDPGDIAPGNSWIAPLLHGISIHHLRVDNTEIPSPEAIHDPAYTGLLGRIRFSDAGVVLAANGPKQVVRITYEVTL